MTAKRLGFVLSLLLALALPLHALTSPKLTIRLIQLTSPVSPGAAARVIFETLPGANCKITVVYKSGPSRAQGLVPKRADEKGWVTWWWRVGTRTAPGTWPIYVACVLGSQRTEIEALVTVR